jgi:protein TonB
MIAVLDPSPLPLARLYDRERPPFRLTPKTLAAIGLVAAVQFGIGYSIAHTYFPAPPQDQPAEPNSVTATLQRLILPKPRTPEPVVTPAAPPKPLISAPPIHDTPAPTTVVDTLPTVAHTDAPAADSTIPPFVQPDRGPVAQPSPPKDPPVIGNPNWLSKPTPDQVGRLYPPRAVEREMSGKAVLLCEVLASGAVGSCDVTDETPKGYGFGQAALAMTRYFKLSPRTVDGVSVAGSKVRIPIVFSLG